MNHIDYTEIQRRAQLERARYMRNLLKVGLSKSASFVGKMLQKRPIDQLRTLSDYQLRDIGIARCDIDRVVRNGRDRDQIIV